MLYKTRRHLIFIVVFAMILSMNVGVYANENFINTTKSAIGIDTNKIGGDSETDSETGTEDDSKKESDAKNTSGSSIEVVEKEELEYSIEYLLKETEEPVPGLETKSGTGVVEEVIAVEHPQLEGYAVLENQPEEFTISEDLELNKIVVYYSQEVEILNTSLTINHLFLDENGEEELIETEIIEDLEIGSIIYSKEYLLDDDLELLISQPEELELKEDENQINLFYERPFRMGENPDGLSGPEYIKAPNIKEYRPGSLGPFNDQVFSRMMMSPMSFSVLSHTGDHGNIEPPAPGSLDINKWATPTANPNQWRVDLTLTGKDIPTTSDIVLVIDRSGSMDGTKMTDAKAAAVEFVNTLLDDPNDTSTRIAVVSFAGGKSIDSGFKDSSGKASLISAINGLSTGGGTFIQTGLKQASALLDGSSADKRSIVLLGDGAATYSYKPNNPNSHLEHWYYQSGRDYYRTKSSITSFDYTTTVGTGYNENDLYESGGTRWWDAYRNYYRHGAHSIAEAGFTKTKGYEIYTIALDAGQEGDWTLDGIADSGNAYTGSSSDLNQIFQTIAGSLSYAATDATITDPIGDMFSIPGINSSNYESKIHVNRGSISWDDATETITWELDTISEGNPAEMWYIVEIDNSAESGVVYPTNKHTYIEYTNALDNSAQKTFPEPKAGIDAGTIEIHYYRVDSTGQPINTMGQPITKEQAELQVLDFPGPLSFNTPYNVSGPATVTIGGTDYQYNATGNVGNPNPDTITLTAANPSEHVWFAYEEVTDVTVTYTTDGNGTITGNASQTIPHGSDTTSVTAVPNTGYYFVKWDDNNTNPTRHEENVTADATYTAIFELKQDLTVTAESDSKVYDGTPLTNNNASATGILSGHTMSQVTVTGSQTLVGSSSNVASAAVILDGANNDVTANYNITYVDGTLTITQAPIPEAPAMEVTKTESYVDANQDEMINVGDTITYTLSVENTGNVNLTNIVITDPLLDLDIVVAELQVGESWSQTESYEITQADIDNGSVTNILTAEAEELEEPEEDQVITNLEETPELTVEKSADKSQFSSVGERITYTYLITNKGNVTISGPFTIEDDKIGTIVAESMPESLSPGETFTVTGQYDVSRDDMDEGSVTNIVEVTGIFGEEDVIATDTETVTRRSSGGGGGGGGGRDDDDDEVIIDEEIPETFPVFTEDHIAYIQGYPDNTVQPTGYITREEVTAVFYRLLETNYRNSIWTETNGFTDVELTRWSLKHIGTLSNGNIVLGYPDRTFRPGNNITRAELAAIASRFDNLSPSDTNLFSDIDGHWAAELINSASIKGWVNGYPDGTFKPDQYITRAEFVTLVNNVLGRNAHLDYLLDDRKEFPDLIESDWFYEDMQEAINSHLFNWREDGFEEWTEITYPRIEM